MGKKKRSHPGDPLADCEVVMTTVACGLRAGLLCSALCFVPMFKKVADVIGVYRWVAGLYANHYVLTQLANGESIGLSAMAGTPWSAWKTFFDQIISALSGRENWHTAGVKAFLKDHGGALYNDKDTTSPRWRLPRPMPSKLTENTTLEMQRVALLHIQGKAGGGGFEAKRIYPYMRQWLAADQLRAGPKIHPETKKGIALMLKFVKGEAGAVATEAALLAALGDEVAALAMAIASEGKAALQPYYNTPFKERTLAGVLIHARRYSLWAEQWADTNHVQDTDTAGVRASKEARLKKWGMAKITMPKVFSLLPVQSLGRPVVHFELTALRAFFSWVSSEIGQLGNADGPFEENRYDGVKDECADTARRFRALLDVGPRLQEVLAAATKVYKAHCAEHGLTEDLDPLSPYSLPCAGAGEDPVEGAKMTLQIERNLALEAVVAHKVRKSQLFLALVDIKHFKGKNRDHWERMRLSTDSVKMCVTFKSTAHVKAANINALLAAGYSWPEPATRIDATAVDAGVYRSHQWRNDLFVPEGRDVELVAIDPGKRVAVQAATAPLSMCGDPGALATYLATTEGAFFSMDKAEWEEGSGRKEGVEREAAARRADPVYRRWCEADDKGHEKGEEQVYRRWREADDRGRKKTANLRSFGTYLAGTLGRAELLLPRLLGHMRPVHKWREARKRMSALARLADRIWVTRPVDNRRRRAAAEAAAAAGVLPPTQLKRIVALGDGLFSGGFPKTPFARELAVRGPTLIVDEYFTSKKCPCGHPLENMPAFAAAACLGPTDASRHPRRHTGSGGPAPCCAMLPFSDKGTDRDDLACMCILQCMAAGLDAHPFRPNHLSSPKDQDGWQKRKLAHMAN